MLNFIQVSTLANTIFACFLYSSSPFYSDLSQLTFSGKRSGEGYFSYDDRKIVYQSEGLFDNPFYQIYTLDLINGASKLVTSGIGKTTCAWIHPNNYEILYASTHLDPNSIQKQKDEFKQRLNNTGKKYSWDYDENYDLFIQNTNTGSVRRLTFQKGMMLKDAFPIMAKAWSLHLIVTYMPATLIQHDQLKICPSTAICICWI